MIIPCVEIRRVSVYEYKVKQNDHESPYNTQMTEDPWLIKTLNSKHCQYAMTVLYSKQIFHSRSTSTGHFTFEWYTKSVRFLDISNVLNIVYIYSSKS